MSSAGSGSSIQARSRSFRRSARLIASSTEKPWLQSVMISWQSPDLLPNGGEVLEILGAVRLADLDLGAHLLASGDTIAEPARNRQ